MPIERCLSKRRLFLKLTPMVCPKTNTALAVLPTKLIPFRKNKTYTSAVIDRLEYNNFDGFFKEVENLIEWV